MAYINEDILYNNVEEKYKFSKGEARRAYSDVLDTICEMPRGDVVSRADVVKEKIEIIREILLRIKFDSDGSYDNGIKCFTISETKLNNILEEYIKKCSVK